MANKKIVIKESELKKVVKESIRTVLGKNRTPNS